MKGLQIFDIVLAVIGLYDVVWGIATLVTGKVYGYGRDISGKYTEESIHAAAPILGIGILLIGLALGVPKLGILIPALAFLNENELAILIGGAVVGCLFVFLGYRKFEEKKTK